MPPESLHDKVSAEREYAALRSRAKQLPNTFFNAFLQHEPFKKVMADKFKLQTSPTPENSYTTRDLLSVVQGTQAIFHLVNVTGDDVNYILQLEFVKKDGKSLVLRKNPGYDNEGEPTEEAYLSVAIRDANEHPSHDAEFFIYYKDSQKQLVDSVEALEAAQAELNTIGQAKFTRAERVV